LPGRSARSVAFDSSQSTFISRVCVESAKE
jgi:hypothetical protein